MSEMQDYKSRVSDPASRKFETFSYLPQMTTEQIRKQIEFTAGWIAYAWFVILHFTHDYIPLNLVN